jgi:hypothetical protein
LNAEENIEVAVIGKFDCFRCIVGAFDDYVAS